MAEEWFAHIGSGGGRHLMAGQGSATSLHTFSYWAWLALHCVLDIAGYSQLMQ
jgi:hypothetical protein